MLGINAALVEAGMMQIHTFWYETYIAFVDPTVYVVTTPSHHNPTVSVWAYPEPIPATVAVYLDPLDESLHDLVLSGTCPLHLVLLENFVDRLVQRIDQLLELLDVFELEGD